MLRWIAVSEDLQAWLCASVRAARTKVVLVRNGVDTQQFNPHETVSSGLASIFPEPFLSANGLVVGTVGRLDAVKNQHLLLDAVACANRQSSSDLKSDSTCDSASDSRGFKLALIGDGAMLESLHGHAKALQPDLEVWFAGARQPAHYRQ